MSNIEYDLDVSGGLMPQVQALIAPPTSDEAPKLKKNGKVSEHPYFKRPGKGHNHDCCDACMEGGDLICCDKCPASFHLTCHDPPLDETDIPAGQWLCHTCRSIAEEAKNKCGEAQARNKRSGSNCSAQSSTKAKKTKPSSLELLVKAASMLNPRQFELPKDMNLPCVFPGTDKVEAPIWSRRGRTTKARAKPHELASGGLVPLPARKCHECGRSCRVAPLLACDYCPLLFHLDCLDPPLTALPAGRWMCPNHVEQFIDSKLVTSVSATERMRLWDRFSGPIDQDAIKTEFFRKVHCKNPPFRIKVRLSRRKCVKVPPMVVHHYKNPVPLLPSLRDVLRLESVHGRNRGEECVADVINNGYVGSGQENVDVEKLNGQIGAINGQIVDSGGTEMQGDDVIINGLTKIKTEDVMNGPCNGSVQKDLKLPDVVSGIHIDIERELKQLDDRLIKLLAYQRIQHLLAQNETNNQSLATLITNSLQNSKPLRHMPLPSELLTPADIDRISRVFTSPKKNKIRLRSKSQLRARAMLCPVVSKHFYNVRTSEVDPANVRHDASFMGFRPTVSARFPEAMAMRYRCMTIGRGSTNDIELERFGHCNYTSAKHAVIFYDECTKHYELMNYSEYGTQVNNVLYSCDLSEKPGSGGTVNSSGTGSGSGPGGNRKDDKTMAQQQQQQLVSTVRDIIDRKRGRGNSAGGGRTGGGGGLSRSTASGPERMCAQELTAGNGPECQCGGSPPADLAAGWEGTAVLNHGSLIRFGCVTFVFSIVDCASV